MAYLCYRYVIESVIFYSLFYYYNLDSFYTAICVEFMYSYFIKTLKV